MKDLVRRKESRKHIVHKGKADPNALIYDSYRRNNQKELARRFLEYRKLWEAAGPDHLPGAPIHVTFGLNDSCNLACAHCYRTMNPDRTPKRYLEFEEVCKIIDECKKIGVRSIGLGTESELFLYRELKDLIRYISGEEFEDTWVHTNGILMDAAYSDLLIENNVTRLSISIDAISDGTFKRVRGDGFYRLMSNIFTFLEKREMAKRALPILRVTFIDYNLNRDEKEGFIDFWSGVADEVDVQSFIDVRNVDALKYDTLDKISCNYPNRMLYVNWNGDYKPCCNEFCKHLTIGNIKDMTLLEAWSSEYLNGLRRQLAGRVPLNKVCINCIRSFWSDTKYKPIAKGRK